jgi:multiple sugar transport system substrate-binding protein
LLFLLSCGDSENHPNHKLIYWSSNHQDEILFAKEVVSEWNASKSGFPVHTQPVPEGQSSEEVILAAVVGKTTPDIYSNMWPGDVETYAQAKALIALDTLSGFLPFLYERCDSLVIEDNRSSDGHIYQIPWKINPIMMISNKKHMREIGFVPPPVTYSDFLEAGRRVQKDTDGDGYVDRWVGYSDVKVTWWQRFFDFYSIYIAASQGGSLIKNNQVAFDNDFAVQTFAFLQKLYKNKYFAQERLDARQDAFLSEIISSRFTGPWEIARAEKFKPQGFEYEFTHLPVPDDHTGPVYTYGDPKNFVIFSTCQNLDEAWQFLKFILNQRNDLRFLQMSNQLPWRKNIFEDPFFKEYFQNNPKMIPFGKQAKFVKGTDMCPVLKEVFDIISQEYEACVIYGRKEPEQAIRDAADAVRLLLM